MKAGSKISAKFNHKLHAKLPAKLSATYTSILRLDEVGALEFLLFVLGTDIKKTVFSRTVVGPSLKETW